MNKYLIKTIIFFILLISISTTAKAVQNVTTEEEINNAIQSNETEIVLQSDIYLENTVTIPQDKNITLDLNGKQITVKKTGERSLYAIDNNGTFTLRDSVGTGAITARGIENLPGGNMTIESGTIIAADSNGGAAIWNDGNLTINGGALQTTYVGTPSDRYGAGCLNNGGTAKINGGTFTGANRRTYAIISTGEIELNNTPIVSGAHGGLAIDAGIATVNGGTYSSDDYYGLYVSNDGTGLDPEKAQVTVNNGEFTGKTYSVWIGSDVNNPVNSTIEIYGGTFNKPLNVQNNVEENAGIKVFGGRFANDVTAYLTQGYICKNIDNSYIVFKEHSINILEVQNGTVQANLQKAYSGDNIQLVITPNEGYEFGSLKVTDKNGNIAVANNQFTMPDNDVNIEVTFKKLTQELEPVNNSVISLPDQNKTQEILIGTINQNPELAELTKTTNLNIVIQAKDVEISNELQTKMQDKLSQKSQNIKIEKFIEITISVRDKNNNNIEVGKLTDLKEPITLTVAIPEDMPKLEEGYERIYYIVREHNGEIEILDTKLSEDGKTIEFTSDKFSAYAIAYEDKRVETNAQTQENNNTIQNLVSNPSTGDIIVLAVIVLGASIAGLIGTNKIKRR